MRFLLTLPLLLFTSGAFAFEIGSFRLDAHAGAGSNGEQGVYYTLGADFYTFIEDHLAVGVGGYYSAGNHPNWDREIGGGPFASYSYPLLSFLVPSIREDIDYIDERVPILSYYTGQPYDYKSYYGVASITS